MQLVKFKLKRSKIVLMMLITLSILLLKKEIWKEELHNGTFSRSEELPRNLAGAVTAGDSKTLRGSPELRVMFQRPDLSGVTAGHLEALGFSVVNSQQLQLQNLKFGMLLTCCLYDLAVCILAAIGGWALYAWELCSCERKK